MRKLIYGALLVMTAALSGCMTAPTAPTPNELATADYGRVPTVADAERLALPYWRDRALDPASIVVRVTAGPARWWVRNGQGQAVYGHLFDIQVNGKNTFGGYTGWQPGHILVKNGQLLWAWTYDPSRHGNMMLDGDLRRIP